MTLRVTNTLSGEQEPFEPADDEVLLYYCGLTTSDPAHVGHARGWVVVDVFHRWLDHLGYDVRHVENFTDVNEKIVARVGSEGDSEDEVAEHYVGEILADMRSLNLLRADVYPRVSEHVPEIIDLVERLVDAGYAYEANGSVYFDVTAFEDYGRLSNQSIEDIESQGDPEELDEKRHPQDFALWKADGVPAEAVAEHRDPDHPGHPEDPHGQTWSSPWGEGRPGWHVECSAMSMTHLDETIDVHVGGRDILFPHHENEIAQSEAATGEQFARYWMHVGMVQVGDAEKMSSSLRNFTRVADAVDELGANVLRSALLSRSYGSPLSYDEDAIQEAAERWDRLERAHRRAVEALDSPDARTKVEDEALRDAVTEARGTFRAAMNDDLDTRGAVAALLDLSAATNRHVDGGDGYDYRGLRRAVETFEDLGEGVLGFAFDGDTTGDVGVAEDVIRLALDVREEERAAGNYDRADDIRDRLEALGVEVQDTDDGPTFRIE
jgi:cysteinyl-tRNA synthetase